MAIWKYFFSKSEPPGKYLFKRASEPELLTTLAWTAHRGLLPKKRGPLRKPGGYFKHRLGQIQDNQMDVGYFDIEAIIEMVCAEQTPTEYLRARRRR